MWSSPSREVDDGHSLSPDGRRTLVKLIRVRGGAPPLCEGPHDLRAGGGAGGTCWEGSPHLNRSLVLCHTHTQTAAEQRHSAHKSITFHERKLPIYITHHRWKEEISPSAAQQALFSFEPRSLAHTRAMRCLSDAAEAPSAALRAGARCTCAAPPRRRRAKSAAADCAAVGPALVSSAAKTVRLPAARGAAGASATARMPCLKEEGGAWGRQM
jgi:hypothetical protein